MLRLPVIGNGEVSKQSPTNIIVVDKNLTIPIASQLVKPIPLTVISNKQISTAGIVVPSKSTTIVSAKTKTPISPEYRELFTALFKIKDGNLTKRFLAAINQSNNDTLESLCSKCRGPLQQSTRTNSETQTPVWQSENTQPCQTNYINQKPNAEFEIKHDCSISPSTNQLEKRKRIVTIGPQKEVNHLC